MNEKHRTNTWQRIVRAFKTRWLLPFLGGLVGLTVALVLAFAVVTPSYESQSQVIVNCEGPKQNEKIYQDALTSSVVLDPVREAVPEASMSDELVDNVAIDADEDTGVLTISAQNRSPQTATQINQQLTDSFIQSAPEILSISQAELLSRASTPSKPTSPSAWIYGLVGTLIGLLVTSAVLIFEALRDDSIYSESVVNDLGWDLIGVLPEISQEEIELTRFKREQPPMTSDETKRRL